MTIVWQKVKNFEYVGACRYTGYVDKSVRLYLECGHSQYRKASQGVPGKARCRDCEHEMSEWVQGFEAKFDEVCVKDLVHAHKEYGNTRTFKAFDEAVSDDLHATWRELVTEPVWVASVKEAWGRIQDGEG